MLVLAVESATETAGVALADEGGVLASATLERGRRHAESIAPAIGFVLAQARSSPRDLDGVCVDVGPGLFTGLRVGIATGKGLAFALGVPVVGATSLEVLALALAGSGAEDRLVVPVVDARRGEVFSARFRVGAHGARPGSHSDCPLVVQETEDALYGPEDLALSLEGCGERFVLVGDGASRYAPLLSRLPGAVLAPGLLGGPSVRDLARLGVARMRAGLGVRPEQLAARYLREADVRINWEQRLPAREPSGAKAR